MPDLSPALVPPDAELRCLLDGMEEGLLFETSDRRIRFANAAFTGLFGVSAPPEALVGTDGRAGLEAAASLARDPEAFVRGAHAALEGRRARTDLVALQGGRVLERRYVPFVVDGATRGHLWRYRDVTDAQRAEGAVAALAESEKRLRLALDAAGLGTWSLVVATQRAELDAQARAILCLDADEVSLRTLFERVHPDDREATVDAMQATATEGHAAYAYRVRLPGGGVRIVEAHGMALRNAAGAPVRLIGTVRDATPERTREDALRATEARQRALLQALPDLVFRLRRDGVYLDVHAPGACALVAPRDEIIGRGLDDAVPEPLATTFRDLIDRTLASGVVQQHEYELDVVDGRLRCFDARMAPAGPDEVVLVVRDVTEWRRGEEALRESAQFLDTVYRGSDVPTFVIDVHPEAPPERRLVFAGVNPAHERLTGMTTAWIEGRTPEDLGDHLPPEAVAHVRGRCEACLEAGRAVSYEEMLLLSGGETWWITRLTPLFDDEGRPYRLIGTALPITEQKRTERALDRARAEAEVLRLDVEAARARAESADRARSAFLAGMSHEIRTPLNGVIGTAELLLETRLSDAQREAAEVIRTSSDALLTRIDDLLDVSKIEAGHLGLEQAPFDPCAAVGGALGVVALKASEKRIRLATRIAPGVPARVEGDEVRLRQVLLNLLSNAVAFTHRGEVTVEVAAEAPEEGVQRLRFAVRDTGVGIPEDRIDGLFERFDPLDGSATRTFGGPGLGLAITKRLVELMGGTIAVESAVGEGTTFRFDVVLGTVRDAEASGRSRPSPLAGARLLVVDADAAAGARLVAHARTWGAEAAHVAASEGALRVFEAGAFDGVVIDFDLPGFDGVELAGALRDRCARTPFVLLSAVGTVRGRTLEEAQRLFAARLTKPIRPEPLRAALARVLAPGGSPADAPEPPPGDVRPLRVLLVEDDPVNRTVALRLLERLGHAADVAENGAEALAALAARPYDVVFVDVRMPGMDGVACTRRIRAERPADEQPWIVALTADALVGDRERFLRDGADDCVAKPPRLDALRAALAAVVPRRPQAADAAPVLDAAVLAALTDELDDPEAVRLVLRGFATSIPGYVAAVGGALAAGALADVACAAHTLKGSASAVGAARLAEASRRVEALAGAGDAEALREAVPAFERVAEETGRAYRAHAPAAFAG